MKKRILSISLAALMVVSLLPVTALAAGNDDWEKLGAALAEIASAPTTGGSSSFTVDSITGGGYKITLQNDITATEGNTSLSVSGAKTLDLNGHVINANDQLPNDTGSVITVSSGANLTITDNSTGKYTYFKYVKGGAWTLDTTTPDGATELADITNETLADTLIKLPGGCITGGTGTRDVNYVFGGGVYVQKDGTLNMHGGNITGNTAETSGGGVYEETGGAFNMAGGNITGNTVDSSGGGVYVAGEFTMSGDSKISYNHANGAGGVYVNGGTFKMSGGSVEHNSANSGGGVFFALTNGTAVILGGKAKIINNTAGKNEDASNFYLTNKKFITLGTKTTSSDGNDVDAPSPGMLVGVTMSNPGKFVEEEGSLKNAKCFTSDVGSKYVYHRGDNTLWLLNDWGALGNELAATEPKTMTKVTGSDDVSPFTVSDKTITLNQDITAVSGDQTLTVENVKELDLNGNVINGKIDASTSVGSVIIVNGTLTLSDSGSTTEHYFGYSESGAWTLIPAPTDVQKNTAVTLNEITSGTTVVKLTGGVITGGSNSGDAGGVYVNGTLNMSGGNIVGNTAGNTTEKSGGGVYVNASAAFTMSGGSITGNRATGCGGGVFNNKGTFTMSDGEIGYNRSEQTDGGGGGVAAFSSGTSNCTTELSGGKIIKNYAVANGGGVYAFDHDTTSGTVAVKITDAEITGNTAGNNGGGVAFSGTNINVTLGGEAKITGNIKGEMGTSGVLIGDPQNVFLPNGKYITLGTETTAPKAGMSVGVTTQTAPVAGAPVQITTNGTAGDVQYFTSDSDNYYVEHEASTLKLAQVTGEGNVLNTTQGKRYQNLTAAISDVSTGEGANDTLKLLADVTGNITVGKNITLDLNGKVLSASAAGSSVIKVNSGKTLTLTDSNPTAAHAGYVDATGLWHLGAKGSVLTAGEYERTIYGGCITGGNASKGGGVYDNGTFNMNGGSIVGNTASEGGGVYVYENKTFTMIGGNIVSNTVSTNGGGVSVDNDGANVTLGGTAQIVENFRVNGGNKTAYNYYVLGYKDNTNRPIKTFSLGTGNNAPESGMKVGITMQESTGGEFTTNAKETQVGYFTPDDKTFGVRLSSANGIELAKLYAITTGGITNGTITTNATENKAFADDTVTITVTPSSGYRLKANTLKAVYDDGEEKTCKLTPGAGTTYTFTMPAYAVAVSAEFEKTVPGDTALIDPILFAILAGQALPFRDVDQMAWSYDDIYYVWEKGLMQGTSKTTFAPHIDTSRAMIVTMLWRLEGAPVVNYAMSFSDVAPDQWYTEAIRWAQANNIVNGYSAEKFGPNDPITREQMAAILYRYAQSKGEGFTGSWMFLLDFADRTDVSDWADEAMHWCVMKGLINGVGNNLLDPQGYAKREQVAAILHRFCENIVK